MLTGFIRCMKVGIIVVELIIKLGKGYYKPVHTMYFHNREEMFDFIKKLNGVSSQAFTYEWEELDAQVELSFKCNVCGQCYEDIETFSEHKLTEHTQ